MAKKLQMPSAHQASDWGGPAGIGRHHREVVFRHLRSKTPHIWTDAERHGAGCTLRLPRALSIFFELVVTTSLRLVSLPT